MRWRLELSCYSYDITYRPRKEDAFCRICANINNGPNKIKELHDSLCHPGIRRFNHWIRTHGRESTVSTGDLAPLPSIDEYGSDPIEILSPSHEQDYTQVFFPSDPTPLQYSPAPTVETPLSQNATTPQSITALPPQNVAQEFGGSQRIFKITTSGRGECRNQMFL
ncbi:hypothetical protein ILUMI_21124 [Ignelater luminosus]|uniref:Uncharacterized protein n=1 Tax=Ignelater luminosus TaxID=2038154 RepID=A0A8K0CGY4_IGNLU|nr:hypothetical protein ILUMI_21124 [Ignelater luminosus]